MAEFVEAMGAGSVGSAEGPATPVPAPVLLTAAGGSVLARSAASTIAWVQRPAVATYVGSFTDLRDRKRPKKVPR